MRCLTFDRDRTFLGAACLLLVAGCVPHYVAVDPNSYVIRQRNYTYAIYNSEHRLMTHPLTDLRLQMQRRNIRCMEQVRARQAHPVMEPLSDGLAPNHEGPLAWDRPITDIFVMSHGWNYSATEAVATYHNFIEVVDEFMQRRYKRDPSREAPKESRDCLQPMEGGYQPFFIFVAWTSTAKPLSDLAGALLPFDFNDLLKPVTHLLDSYPLHLATAWKQSLNAASNAIGEGFPDSFFDIQWDEAPFGIEAAYEQDRRFGRNLPLSALVFELIKCKYRKRTCAVDGSGTDMAPLQGVSIHLVGHSYGAKLVTLAGMEGMRRWLVTEAIPCKLGQGFSDDRCFDSEPPPRAAIEEHDVKEQELAEWTVAIQKLGHQSSPQKLRNALLCRLVLLGCPDEDRATITINEVIARFGGREFPLPIESLILFNPAMHPGELWYPTNGNAILNKAPASLLRLVARKAIVYNETDLANGTIFNLRELLLNTQVAQFYQSLAGSNKDETGGPLGYRGQVIFDYAEDAVLAPLAIAYSALYGAAINLGTTLSNLLLDDLAYHVMHNDSLADPQCERDEFNNCLVEREWYIRWPLRAFNFVDYFAPVIWRLAPFREEDKQGLLRLSRPALGKTGVNRLAAGRDPEINLWGLSSFYSDTSNNPARDYTPIQFCLFAHPLNEDRASSAAAAFPYKQTRHQIYSFNASMVYDSWLNSHSDFSEHAEVTCDREQTRGYEMKEQEKRRFTSTFVYRFAKTNFLNHPALQSAPH